MSKCLCPCTWHTQKVRSEGHSHQSLDGKRPNTGLFCLQHLSCPWSSSGKTNMNSFSGDRDFGKQTPRDMGGEDVGWPCVVGGVCLALRRAYTWLLFTRGEQSPPSYTTLATRFLQACGKAKLWEASGIYQGGT